MGASTGGVRALMAVAASLPVDLPAAVLVALHVAPDGPEVLSELLDRAGPLPAASAVDGALLRAGQVAVAPPGRHLSVDEGRLRLTVGSPTAGARPSIDLLFDSLVPLGARAVAVVLSGTLGDGSAGLGRVGAAGGHTIVQDPDDADFPGMPRRAAVRARPDHVLPLGAIGPRIVSLLAGLPGAAPGMLAAEEDADAP